MYCSKCGKKIENESCDLCDSSQQSVQAKDVTPNPDTLGLIMTNIKKSTNLMIANAFNLEGRTSRANYWWAAIPLAILGSISVFLIDYNEFLSVIFGVIAAVPSVTLSVRRFHDIGKPGYYFFTNFIPVAGSFIFLYLTVQKGDETTNQYGPIDRD